MKLAQLSNLPTNKILLFSFNIIFLLVSCALIGLGSWLVDIIDEKPNIPAIKEKYTVVGGLMLAAGIAGFFTASFGFALTVCRNKYSIFTYFVLVFMLLLLGIAVGIVGLVFADRSELKISQFLTKDLLLSNSQLADQIQREFKCCGLNGPNDWENIPSSCCADISNADCQNGSNFKKGCISAVSDSISLDLAISGGISLAVGLILLLGVILASHSFLEIHEKNKNNAYERNF